MTPLFTEGICCDKGYQWNVFALPHRFLVFSRINAPQMNNTAHITFLLHFTAQVSLSSDMTDLNAGLDPGWDLSYPH